MKDRTLIKGSTVFRSEVQTREDYEISKKSVLQWHFYEMKPLILSLNVMMVDTKLPEIIALIIKEVLFNQGSNLSQLLSMLHESNKLSSPFSLNLYEYKIKKLIFYSFCNDFQNSIWNGKFDIENWIRELQALGIVVNETFNFNKITDILLADAKLKVNYVKLQSRIENYLTIDFACKKDIFIEINWSFVIKVSNQINTPK